MNNNNLSFSKVRVVENRVEREWVDKWGNKLTFGSYKGKWDELLKDFITKNYPHLLNKKDRVYWISINSGEIYVLTHDQQVEILKAILDNDILPNTFNENVSKFEFVLEELRANRGKNAVD